MTAVPAEPVKPGQPGEPLGVLGHVFGLVLVGAGHHEAAITLARQLGPEAAIRARLARIGEGRRSLKRLGTAAPVG
jgi:hypothetical protein